jgi:predicted unusual protein kinase regulating ubiquinone biosynthesis (AarF/ABC1/UbiB family)
VDVVRRVVQVSTVLGSLGALVALDIVTRSVERNQAARAKQLRVSLTQLGATFIKVGQALSTRPDLLPGPYLDELAELQDALPGFPDAQAFAIIEAELGRPLETVYSQLTPQPVAAASLGQVYKATLLDGTPVAVKVQRPGTAPGMELDFYVLRSLAATADELITSLNTSLTAAVDDFASKVFGELDYVSEGRNAERFASLYGTLPRVIVPTVHWEATTSRVLTLQWIDGIKLSDTAGLAASGLSVVSLVDVGIQCSLRQLLTHGYFHADPHPGNLLGTADGSLAFLDFGIMAECPMPARQAIIAHVVHLVNRDYRAMAKDYYALGFLEPTVDTSPIAPALAAFFDDVLTASVSDLNFKSITDGLGGILYAYPFNVPAYYALILRSLTVLEGLALSSDPNFKVLAAAYPYFAAQLLASSRTDAPALRDSLTELLIGPDGTVRWSRLENLLAQAKKSSSYASPLQVSTPSASASGDSGMAATALATLADVVLGPQDGTASETDGIAAASPLRLTLEKEAARVLEALALGGGGSDEDDAAGRQLVQALMPPGIAQDVLQTALQGIPSAMATQLVTSPQERAQLASLRASVLRCAALLLGTDAATPRTADLSVLTNLASEPRAARFLTAVAQRVGQRALARGVQAALKSGDSAQGTSQQGAAALAR